MTPVLWLRRSALAATCVILLSCSGSSSSPTIPGGEAGADVLEDAGRLDDGVVTFGPVAPDDVAVQEAICAYVVGTPAEVAEVAELDGEVSLDEDSGYQILGAGGTGVRCLYGVGGEPVFGVWLWDQELGSDSDGPPPLLEVQVEGGHFGSMSYAPDYDGDTIDDDTATDWLNEAGARYGGGSV